MIRHSLLLLAILLFVTSSIACLDSGDDTKTPTVNSTIDEHNSPTASTPLPTYSPPSTPSDSGEFSAASLSTAIADMVEQVQPAVVFISAQVETTSFFFNQRSVQSTSGSGVIVSPEGYILTNNHVVEGAIELEVTLPGLAETFEAEIIGTDPLTDLAVIQIDGDNLPTVTFGNASELRPGNLVIAMGYPLALEHGATITLGVVSNTERSFTLDDATFYDVIQTDAAINQGNSGGPLVNLQGQLVGINSVLAGMAQNIGFAISTNTAKPVYEALISDDHRVARPWLGVSLVTVTPDVAADIDLSRQSGVVIRSVEDGSPADEAGLQVRDVITEFEGMEVTEATQLIKELWHYEVGEEVTLTYWRDDDKKESTITLSVERPE